MRTSKFERVSVSAPLRDTSTVREPGVEARGRVAPHEKCEVRLVLSGSKPLATIEASKDMTGYAMAVCLVNAGQLRGYCRPTDDCVSGEIVIVKPGNQYLINEYLYTLEHGVEMWGIKGYHRKMGKLFGYTDADIEAFIEAEIHCDCTKCNGGSK